MPAILFDIDGTLVRTQGAGKASMQQALGEAFGVSAFSDEVPFSGRTDAAIMPDMLRAHGVPATPENADILAKAYLANLWDHLVRLGGEVCPGVSEMLPELSARPDVLLGLLTGNMREGARLKLTRFGLWDYFDFGGFGDGFTERDDVARAAVELATARTPLEPSEVWVIGDTPLDVSCARAVGARAVAVATGWHTLDELKACNPDYAVASLADAPGLLDWIAGGPGSR